MLQKHLPSSRIRHMFNEGAAPNKYAPSDTASTLGLRVRGASVSTGSLSSLVAWLVSVCAVCAPTVRVWGAATDANDPIPPEDHDLFQLILTENNAATDRIARHGYRYSRECHWKQQDPPRSETVTGAVTRDGGKVWSTEERSYPAEGGTRPVEFVTIINDRVAAYAEELSPIHACTWDPGRPMPAHLRGKASIHLPPRIVDYCKIFFDTSPDAPVEMKLDAVERLNDGKQLKVAIVALPKTGDNRQEILTEYTVDSTRGYLVTRRAVSSGGHPMSIDEVSLSKIESDIWFPTRRELTLYTVDAPGANYTEVDTLDHVILNPEIASDQFELSRLPHYDGETILVETEDKSLVNYYLGGEVVDEATLQSFGVNIPSPSEQRERILSTRPWLGGPAATKPANTAVSTQFTPSNVPAVDEPSSRSGSGRIWIAAGLAGLGVVLIGAAAKVFVGMRSSRSCS